MAAKLGDKACHQAEFSRRQPWPWIEKEQVRTSEAMPPPSSKMPEAYSNRLEKSPQNFQIFKTSRFQASKLLPFWVLSGFQNFQLCTTMPLPLQSDPLTNLRYHTASHGPLQLGPSIDSIGRQWCRSSDLEKNLSAYVNLLPEVCDVYLTLHILH